MPGYWNLTTSWYYTFGTGLSGSDLIDNVIQPFPGCFTLTFFTTVLPYRVIDIQTRHCMPGYWNLTTSWYYTFGTGLSGSDLIDNVIQPFPGCFTLTFFTTVLPYRVIDIQTRHCMPGYWNLTTSWYYTFGTGLSGSDLIDNVIQPFPGCFTLTFFTTVLPYRVFDIQTRHCIPGY